MARYRLKFLLQEFDLVGPEIVIGRSPDCHVTVEDPLISRQHARILISGDAAQLMDLGSRNGTRVNGNVIDGAHLLHDGDRIRLGAQELLFYVVERTTRQAKTTGFLAICRSCNTPYPDTAPECPHCGATSAREDETFSGLTAEPQRGWTYQLLGEVVEKALSSGRIEEAARMLERVAHEVDVRMDKGDRLEPTQLELVTSYAIAVAEAQKEPAWIGWAIEVYMRHQGVVSEELATRMAAVPRVNQLSALRMYVDWAESRQLASPGLTILNEVFD